MEPIPHILARAPSVTPSSWQAPLPDDWHLGRQAGVNVLVIQRDGAPNLVEALLPNLDEPVARWRPGQRLVLPSVAGTGTMFLEDVGALAADDQRRLLDWLERASGRTQVVSTARGPLLPRVLSGAFLDVLYYRLNTVCVDPTASS